MCGSSPFFLSLNELTDINSVYCQTHTFYVYWGAHLWEVFEAGDGCSEAALERGLDEHDSGSSLSVLVLQQQSV